MTDGGKDDQIDSEEDTEIGKEHVLNHVVKPRVYFRIQFNSHHVVFISIL